MIATGVPSLPAAAAHPMTITILPVICTGLDWEVSRLRTENRLRIDCSTEATPPDVVAEGK